MNKILKYSLWGALTVIVILFCYFFIGYTKPVENITWGVNFSYGQAEFLKLNAKETYTAILDDLRARNIKISVDWDTIEKASGEYDFNILDWEVDQAATRNANVVLAIGMKTPRWPECHMPQWARNLDKNAQQDEILNMLREVVIRYRDKGNIIAWQVENEPLLNFGACPWFDEQFFRKEVAYVKNLDPNHPIITTTSGELSLWIKGSDIGDILGVTTYTKVWQQNLKVYMSYVLPPVFYHRKAMLVDWLFKKPVIGTELQAEPWCANSIMNASLGEQMETMSLKQLQYNIKFAKETGFDTFYLWGAEWWYYMKQTYNDSSFLDEARKLFIK